MTIELFTVKCHVKYNTIYLIILILIELQGREKGRRIAKEKHLFIPKTLLQCYLKNNFKTGRYLME